MKFPQSVMVWGAMSSAGVSDLCFLKSSVNAAVYQDILEYFMVPAADQLFGDNEFIFQQDLAPPHSAKSTQAWCENCHVHVLDWPANSPHFNPIENLWGIVKKKLHKHQPNTCEQLKDAIKTCWNEVTPHECQQLIHTACLVALKLSSRLEVMQQSIDTLGCNLLFSFVVFSLLFLPVIK